ncbi:gliding motility-associated C-terminal domain-containing protein [Hufsiella ginkgonis]|uniref:T9SS type B sorting domain-containing protein n=1 Tax=Hufsiella ginkgonis TaxID=2695274 RepID=A0A7K1XX00_9SPHI|nr:gliding motility-associated C-terminal domain-containing protein [Hufsiella ginkgonis]MXV15510.1 T9SS type B sorting domain-containing protein [Hufsiella ginkgonis]
MLFFSVRLCAQGIPYVECPPNIGFEQGDFTGWVCKTGDTDVGLLNTGVVLGRHTIINSASYAEVDPYGNFPILCPNGSNFTVKLGNNSTCKETESISYTFKIPDGAKNYTVTYNYAVVFEDPEHGASEQPRFVAKVYDVATGRVELCGSADYVSSSAIPGFQRSDARGNAGRPPGCPDTGRGNGQGGGNNNGPATVYFKPWSAVNLDLSAYAGREIRLEFTTMDCTMGGHFGYAYIDVNENCTSPIAGSTICPGSGNTMTLVGPSGYASYTWYTSDFSKVLGNEYTLTIDNLPAVGTIFPLKIVPYPGYGCETTLYAVITAYNEPILLNLPETIVACRTEPVDLTSPAYVAGSTPYLKYTYHTDPEGRFFYPNPKSITSSGTVYVKGYIPSGCFVIKAVNVIVNEPPVLIVKSPPNVCYPLTTDITRPEITAGTDVGVTLSYWSDSQATRRVLNPTAIDLTGTYYIKAADKKGCYAVRPISVVVGTVPVIKTAPVMACVTANITASSVTAGSSSGLFYTYYTDADASKVLESPAAITESNTYYIKGTNSAGCSGISPVKVTVYQLPEFTLIQPEAVVYPTAISLPSLISTVKDGQTYTYSLDEAGKKPVKKTAVNITGTYYVTATNAGGCSVTKPVYILIKPPDDPVVTSINTFTPNGDGVNDFFKLDITGFLRVVYFRIYTRWGEPVFETADLNQFWDGTHRSKKAPIGTYYWVFDSFDDFRKKEIRRSGYITLVR